MQTKLTFGLLSALVWLTTANPSFAQNNPTSNLSKEDDFQPWVQFQDGEVALSFEQTPVPFVLYAIQAKTGLQIVVPNTAGTKVVNLRLPRQPLEPAVRSLISNIGYKNFAMLYDDTGRPSRAIVLGAQVETPKPTPVKQTEPVIAPLTMEEKEKLQKDLERWSDLKDDERGQIEERLKTLPPSDDRDELIKEFGRQILGARKEVVAARN